MPARTSRLPVRSGVSPAAASPSLSAESSPGFGPSVHPVRAAAVRPVRVASPVRPVRRSRVVSESVEPSVEPPVTPQRPAPPSVLGSVSSVSRARKRHGSVSTRQWFRQRFAYVCSRCRRRWPSGPQWPFLSSMAPCAIGVRSGSMSRITLRAMCRSTR